MKEVPDPKGGYPTSFFIGHYGETIELPYGWAAEPRMQAEVEVIRFHRKYKDQWDQHPYRPAESDYKPENFSPMGLMQLIVIPKNAPGGLRSLAAIRSAKEKELKQSGVEYEIDDDLLPSRWPPGALLVLVKKPYRLRQVYAESLKEFFILTTGERPKVGDSSFSEEMALDIRAAHDAVDGSLGDYLLSFQRSPMQQPDCDWFFVFRTGSRFWKIIAAFVILMGSLACWPGRSTRVRKARFVGVSLLAFTLLSGLLGFLVVFIPGQYGIYSQIGGPSPLIPAVLFPLVCGVVAIWRRSSHPIRVLAWSVVLSILLAKFLYGMKSEVPGEYRVFASTLVYLVAGLGFGISFVLAFGALPEETRP